MATLLPLNATRRERALDALAAKKLDINLTPADINPYTCSAKLLPYLAMMRRVDISNLSEPEKRQLIANALEVHRYRGSVYAVQKALDSVFDDIELLEHQRDFEFDAKVTLKVDASAVYDASKFERAKTLANIAKNGRSRFGSFQIGLPSFSAQTNTATSAVLNPQFSAGLSLVANPPITITGHAQWTL